MENQNKNPKDSIESDESVDYHLKEWELFKEEKFQEQFNKKDDEGRDL